MIEGIYTVSSNGVVIGEYKNMLTSNGISTINAFLSGNTFDWAGSLAIGCLNSSSTVPSTERLQYEILRYPVTLKTYSPSGSSSFMVLKTTLDPADDFDCYEIGVIPAKVNLDNYYDNTKISDFSEFSSGSTLWKYGNGNLATLRDTLPATRSGTNNIVLSVTASSLTNTAIINGLDFPVQNFYEGSSLEILYYASTTTSSINFSVKFGDDSTPQNVWSSSTVNLTAKAASAFYTSSALMGPKPDDFDNFTSVSVTFSGSSGAVILDHLKFSYGAPVLNDFKLVSRAISSSSTVPLFGKVFSQPMEVEYKLRLIDG